MNMEGKTEAVLEWARTWEHIGELLKLNAIKAEDGDASLNPAFSTDVLESYIDGTATRQYIFMLKMMLPWSDGNDSENTKAAELMEQWRDWVDLQYPTNVPNWDCEISKIESLYDVPSITVYQEDSLAEYNYQARIIYTE